MKQVFSYRSKPKGRKKKQKQKALKRVYNSTWNSSRRAMKNNKRRRASNPASAELRAHTWKSRERAGRGSARADRLRRRAGAETPVEKTDGRGRSPRYSISRPPEDGLSPSSRFGSSARARQWREKEKEDKSSAGGRLRGSIAQNRGRPPLRRRPTSPPPPTSATSLFYYEGSSRCGGARRGGRRRERGLPK